MTAGCFFVVFFYKCFTVLISERKLGESCNVNETCHEGFECRDDTNNGSVCQCPSDYYEQNDTTCAPSRPCFLLSPA